MATKSYVGDIGTVILVDTKSDLSDATVLELKIKKPSGAIMTKTATIPVGLTGADGIISYTTVAGDFDENGKYYLQAHVEGVSTDHLGVTANFSIGAAFDGN